MYSQYNLISEELKKFDEKNFWEKIISAATRQNTYNFRIPLSRKKFFRLDVLVEDMNESGYDFTPDTLVRKLYLDFIKEVKVRNSMDVLHGILEEISGTRYTGDIGYVAIKMDRKLVLRGEVFLDDMKNLFPKHEYTVEKVLELLLVDYMNDYVREPALKMGELIKELY